MTELSYAARKLWAKKDRDGGYRYLPLITHLEDSAALARFIWSRWLPPGTRRSIASGCGTDDEGAKKLFIFIMAAHDIGKATPLFQAKPSGRFPTDMDERLAEGLVSAGLAMRSYSEFIEPHRSPHALAGELILEGAGCPSAIAAVIGAHHGRPASRAELDGGGEDKRDSHYCVDKSGRAAWKAVRAELMEYALSLAGCTAFAQLPTPDMAAEALLSGAAVTADWIASNEGFFPYITVEEEAVVGAGAARARSAFAKLDFLKTGWSTGSRAAPEAFFMERFGLAPRHVQSEVIRTAEGIAEPGIFIIEAPTGIGKTEAALAAAEIFASVSGRAGLFFALPTQATSDGMFPRLLKWMSALGDGSHSTELVHGKAQFNDVFSGLPRIGSGCGIAEEGAAVYTWFDGRKKAMLADFVVGTVDQLLKLALKQKHLMLRHLALANKVVIIDECHAYDAYMNVYLTRALRWLGRYGTPVILLSATLPAAKRDELVRAYLGVGAKKRLDGEPDAGAAGAYPLITYSDGKRVCRKAVEARMEPVRVELKRLADGDVADALGELLTDGGCAALIVNTVGRAQAFAAMLRERFGDEVRLMHSRFTATDRMAAEKELRRELGKTEEGGTRPWRRIVVGTQTIEQSLDLDFDVMITDLCPIDLIVQRIGRLHRHARPRPEKLKNAVCHILGAGEDGLEAGAAAVYGEYLLLRTRELLPQAITLPDDVSDLVQRVYGGERDALPRAVEGYDEAKEKWEQRISIKEQKARAFRICPPWGDGETITGWLDADVSDAAGEAAVRDSTDSLEVIAVGKTRDGGLCLLSNGRALPRTKPDDATAKLIAREMLRLPDALCYGSVIDRVIAELERRNAEEMPLWQSSPWLKGCLFLIFDEERQASLLGHRLKYDAFYGLQSEREGDSDG